MNPDHLAILQRGVAVWNDWRAENPSVVPDLSLKDIGQCELKGANFRGAILLQTILMEMDLKDIDFSGADLRGANLLGSDLQGSDLHASGLFGAEVSFTMLKGVDISLSDLTSANFTCANLIGANLRGAILDSTNFTEALLVQADLNDAILLETVFGNSNLTNAKGLTSCVHKGPSVIDLRTIVRSGSLPEKFLRRCGIPEEAMNTVMGLGATVKYYTAFIGYGEPDVEFAKRIDSELRAKGVSCWLYAVDSTAGRRTWHEIGERRRAADKMIVLCSAESLIREGAQKEIEEQIDEDPDKLLPVSLDNLWKEKGFPVIRGDRDLKLSLLDRNYADFANQPFNKALDKLLGALRRKS